MKKKFLLIITALILVFASAFIFMAGLSVGREGGNWHPYFAVFIASIFLNFLYYIWLVLKKHINLTFIIFYIPVAIVIFIVFIFLFMYPFWLKQVSFNMGPDPFAPRTTITSHTAFPIWTKEFWSKSAREEYRLNRLKHMQTTRQGSLIGHVGTDLQGWSDEKIKTAFGEPAKIIEVDKSLEKLIYHPWTNHPDWEMPVYVQNGALLKIGD